MKLKIGLLIMLTCNLMHANIFSDLDNAMITINNYALALEKIPTLLSKLNSTLSVTKAAIGGNASKAIAHALESAFNNLFGNHEESTINTGNPGEIVYYMNLIDQHATEIAQKANEFAQINNNDASSSMNPIQFIQTAQISAQKIDAIINNFIKITRNLNSIVEKIGSITPSWSDTINYTGDLLKGITNPSSMKTTGEKCQNISTQINSMTPQYKSQISQMTLNVAIPALKQISEKIKEMLATVQKPLNQLHQLQGA